MSRIFMFTQSLSADLMSPIVILQFRLATLTLRHKVYDGVRRAFVQSLLKYYAYCRLPNPAKGG